MCFLSKTQDVSSLLTNDGFLLMKTIKENCCLPSMDFRMGLRQKLHSSKPLMFFNKKPSQGVQETHMYIN